MKKILQICFVAVSEPLNRAVKGQKHLARLAVSILAEFEHRDGGARCFTVHEDGGVRIAV